MDDHEVDRMWDENAEVWTRLARAGYDIYRNRVNTPAFLSLLPAITGLRGLDIGWVKAITRACWPDSAQG